MLVLIAIVHILKYAQMGRRPSCHVWGWGLLSIDSSKCRVLEIDWANGELQQLLEPFGITKFYTDGWGAYERHIDPEQHHVGKENTQKIESKHINLRTRIKRLVRRTLCFSKTAQMHDLVIGLFINRYEFGRAI